MTIDAGELEDAVGDFERRVAAAVAADDDVRKFVERLEKAADAENEGDGETEPVPSGDVLAREFQRFLSQRGDKE